MRTPALNSGTRKEIQFRGGEPAVRPLGLFGRQVAKKTDLVGVVGEGPAVLMFWLVDSDALICAARSLQACSLGKSVVLLVRSKPAVIVTTSTHSLIGLLSADA